MSDRRNRDIGRRRAYQAKGGRRRCMCWYCCPAMRRDAFLAVVRKLQEQ